MPRTGKLAISSFSYFFRLLITAVFLLGFLPAPALAQTDGVIAGQVTDNATGNPINNATINIFEPGAQSPTWTGNTDNIGIFGIPVPAGTGYGVAARINGYVGQRVNNINVVTSVPTRLALRRQ